MDQQGKNTLVIFDYSNTIAGSRGVYDGIVEQVKELKAKGYEVAIASLAPLAEMKDELSMIPAGNGQSMFHLFNPVIGSEALRAFNNGKADKTSVETGREILAATNASRRQTIVIGDAFTEFLLAKNNGFHYLHAGWGDRDKTGLKMAVFEGSDVPITQEDVDNAQSIPTVDQISLRVEAVLHPSKSDGFTPER